MAKERILVVDDEEDILQLVEYNLKKHNYTVRCVTSGEAALTAAREQAPDLILLDLMLPGLDGIEVCKRLKADPATARTPVIMLTARGEDADVVTGLELGADDYIIKPFSPRVLTARVKALLRRLEGPETEGAPAITRGRVKIDPGRHEVSLDGQVLELTPTEFRLISLLARRPGWVYSRNNIIDQVHGDGYAVSDRSVDVLVAGLRKKLGTDGDLIETVRGVGYRFKEE